MSTTHILEKLRELRLSNMAAALQQQLDQTTYLDQPFEQRLAMLVDAEANGRDNKRIGRLLKMAKLKFNAPPEDIIHRPDRMLDRSTMGELLSNGWVSRKQNILLTGPTGSGKSWLGCCLATQAARHGHSILYRRVNRLLEEMEISRADGSIMKLRQQFAKVRVMVLDDFGLTPLSATGRTDLLELLDDRVGAGSTVVIGQLPTSKWHDFINDPALADAILDRLIHTAHKIELKGESMRKLGAPEQIGR